MQPQIAKTHLQQKFDANQLRQIVSQVSIVRKEVCTDIRMYLQNTVELPQTTYTGGKLHLNTPF